VTQTLAVAAAEIQKLYHDPLELFTRAVQPVLWLLLFGEVMARVRGVSPGNLPYLDFLSAGILAQSVLFVAIFYGISAIWERDLGVLQRYLVSPAPRSALVLGKALSASVRALSQALIVYLLALALGVDIDLKPASIVGVIAVIGTALALFSTFSLIIACIVKTRERFMGIGQVLTMPVFIASNAIYPLSLSRSGYGWFPISILSPIKSTRSGL
jgi:ABC-2 type transport system permease protein